MGKSAEWKNDWEGDLACVDMTAVKARGHGGRKTLGVIHRHCMAHQHIPLSLSHSQRPLISLILTHTHTAVPTHTPTVLAHSLCSVGVVLRRLVWITSPLIRTWEGFFTCSQGACVKIKRPPLGQWKSPPLILSQRCPLWQNCFNSFTRIHK